MTPVSEAQYASDKRTMRGYSQKVRVIDPAITLILVTTDHAKVTRRKEFDAAFDMEQMIVMEGNRPKVIEDVHFWRGVVDEVVTHGGGKLVNFAFSLATAAAESVAGNIEGNPDDAEVNHRPNPNLVIAPAIRVHA